MQPEEPLMRICENPEGWKEKKKILVILAHPDDPEFFCGATIARWCELGHEVNYCLITNGQRGAQDSKVSVSEIEQTRIREQKSAAQLLGVSSVKFLGFMDGDLIPDLELRREIIREIRLAKPNIIVTCDPQNLFPAENRINHPDHRAAGQVVIDAVFPNAGNFHYTIKNVNHTILEPHQVEEVWLALTHQPNLTMEVSVYFNKKVEAITCHESQLNETPDKFREKYRLRWEPDPEDGRLKYFEKFKRIQLVNK